MSRGFRGYLSVSFIAMSSPLLTLEHVSSSPTIGIFLQVCAPAGARRMFPRKRDLEVKGYNHGNTTNNSNKMHVFLFSQHTDTSIASIEHISHFDLN